MKPHLPSQPLRPGVRLARALRRGFTLIEVVLAMGLIGLLVGGVYMVARGAIQVSSRVVDNQQRSMLVHSFTELCRRNFEMMPGNAQIQLSASDTGGALLSELSVVNFPLAFAWSGVPAGSAEVILLTEKEARGSLRVRVVYLTEEEAAERRERRLTAGEMGTSLVLLTNVRVLQWRFFDPRTEEWETEWIDAGRRPSLVELNLEFYDGQEPIRSVMWIPTMANPETIAGAFQAPDAGGAGGAPSGDVDLGNVTLPTDPDERRAALDRLREQRGGGTPPPGGARPSPRPRNR